MNDLPHFVDTFARTLWGEARSCGVEAMSHVANVIINRIDHPGWWGDDVTHVCLAPYQFSCWNKGDPNRPKLLAVTMDDPEFETAVRLAETAIRRKLPDATDGANSYYAIRSKTPFWVHRAIHTLTDGWHAFYRVDAPAEDGGPDAPTVSVHTPETPGEEEADLLDEEFNK